MNARDLSTQRPAASYCCLCGDQIRLTRAALQPWSRHCTECSFTVLSAPQRAPVPRPEHALRPQGNEYHPC